MRPGQSCPGVGGAERDDIPSGRTGFNEAGAIMPRSGYPTIAPTIMMASGFNEAGAIMPRSGAFNTSSSQREVSGFNEAGAIMPRSGLQRVRGDAATTAKLQ